MINLNTGLNDDEKESLLKFFLTHCTVIQKEDINENTLFPYKVKFLADDNVHKDTGALIGKAMMNLQKSVWGI